MEAVSVSETPATLYQSTRYRTP